MNVKLKNVGLLAVLILLVALVAGCQPVAPAAQEPAVAEEAAPAEEEHATEWEPAEETWDVVGSNCKAIPNQALVLGNKSDLDELLPPDLTEQILETVSLVDLEARSFDVLYLIEAAEPESLVEQLRGKGISASLNYATHLFSHSGGDSPFGRKPHPADPPPAVGIAGHVALSETLKIQVAIEQMPMEREIVVGVFDTSSDHGVFVTGLISAVAPGADVHLYKVLEDNGFGETMTILQRVQEFLTEFPPSEYTPVLNFSLGIWCHEPLDGRDGTAQSAFVVLDDLLKWASEQGAVVVGAAGNNSNRHVNATGAEDPTGPGYVRMQEYPASAPFVIGVGSSNNAGTGFACYSHEADVYTPGGDGFPVAAASVAKAPSDPPIPPGAEIYCAPDHTKCTDETCEYGLLSLSPSSPTGYAYWSGTSFAAPLVSGLAARILANDALQPGDVQAIIVACAGGPGGMLIDFPNCP